ncbi:nicotinate-nucleotide adenylyltransferase [Sporobacter termitidis DSM 10068]|uniref:Probable nicotinate-nucleotide adenylyltransferase n=1 Tax=Sporobacter termitidis DSM 10068 TaxID=1123282 RepID=A0A1M5UKN1_9FIRM|nr:bis(5'-nucleosyl)-tetraphosphatase (symmetrical) YqeK [Sporobacter termitidis]SHH63406.1 nicotinate-nucleotide adenylyltransferase [Sporobacter termitidis DSM 10068]
MRLGIYGGTFNPPHIGHVGAAAAAAGQLGLDALLVVPAGVPPHKALPPGSPSGEDRMALARLSFAALPYAQVTDAELRKEGVSYTVETVGALAGQYPGAEVFLIMGTDMYLTLETWKDAARLLACVTPAVLSRGSEDDGRIAAYAGQLEKIFGTTTASINNDIVDISSTQLRELLPGRAGADFIEGPAYAYIIKKRLYGAKPDFTWLRARAYEMMKPKRIPHVAGCEAEAVKLAGRWGADEDEAREAAILHDITKHLELDDQLQLCGKYDIMTDNVEASEVKLLHSKTGAAVARDIFGVSDAVHDAILWHTTGRADMTLLEKIIYIADYIEPTREFEGLDTLRGLAYRDLDLAVIKGLEMSIEDMSQRGITPHLRTAEAMNWLIAHTPRYKGD